MYRPSNQAAIEAIQKQIERLEQNVQIAEERKRTLEKEADDKREEVRELTEKEEPARASYNRCSSELLEKDQVELPKLKREMGKCYSAMQTAKNEKDAAKSKLDAATRDAEQADRLLEAAESRRNDAQEAYNRACNAPETIYEIGQVTPEQQERERCRIVLEAAQAKVDSLLQRQTDAYDKKFNIQCEYDEKEMHFSLAEGEYQSAQEKVDRCEDEIGKLRCETATKKSQWEDVKNQLDASEKRLDALGYSDIPNAAQRVVAAQNTLFTTKPHLEDMLQKLAGTRATP